METKFIEKKDIIPFFKALSHRAELYSSVKEDEGIHLQRLSGGNLEDVLTGGRRTVEPLKALFFFPLAKVAEYPKAKWTPQVGERIVAGARACDLGGFEVLDKVFLGGDFKDPFYEARMGSTLIISADCTKPESTCFCTAMGGKPYPVSGFDLNFSLLDVGAVVEIGSERGEKIIKEYGAFFRKPTTGELKQREKNRKEMTDQVEGYNSVLRIKPPYHDLVKEATGSQIWAKLAERCVECGACLYICPTCRCFLLYDQGGKKANERVMIWDACYFPGYWRMAGGLTPKPRLTTRFENRFNCKFDYFVENYDVEACTGCGRCIEACTAKIDIRECLQELRGKAQPVNEKI